jgi:GNAT superfamily N-acetyltransferase
VTDIVYRRAGPNDGALLVELGGSIFQNDEHRATWTDDWMRQGDGGVVAELDGVPIGVAWYRCLPSPLDAEAIVAQASLRVAEEHRRGGIGTTLLRELMVAADADGHRGLGGQVLKRNVAAVRAAASAGLEDTGGTQAHHPWIWVWKQIATDRDPICT